MGGGDHCYFFHAKATVDVLTTSNNDVNFVETQNRTFCVTLESSFRFKRINKVDRDFLHCQILPSFFAP